MAHSGNFNIRESKKKFWEKTYHFVTKTTLEEDMKIVAGKMRPYGGYVHLYHVEGPDDLEYYFAHSRWQFRSFWRVTR